MNYYTTNIIPAKKKGKSKKLKKKKFERDYSYSSFWLDKDDLWGRDLSSTGTASSSIVKVIKLRSYQRAVSNFVKILTKKEIPVVFHNGSDSFTDGKMIAITSKIDTKNFDVTVGLALHEASHIILTDFEWFITFLSSYAGSHSTLKGLVNWIEDRRIDNYVFKNSPGYKAYYHKLYDHYFNQPSTGKMLKSAQYRTVTVESYMAHIINMTNPAFDPTALPGLQAIVKLIDLPNISRLTSTKDATDVALEVLHIILTHVDQAQNADNQEEDNGDGGSSSNSDNTDATANSDMDNNADSELDDLSDSELREIAKELEKQREFINHNITENDKKKADRTTQKKLDALGNMDVDVEKVGDRWEVVVYNLTKDRKFWNNLSIIESAYTNREPNGSISWHYKLNSNLTDSWPEQLNVMNSFGKRISVAHIQEAINLGNQLGRKLRLVNESRELVYNRLDKGSVDKRRISCLGYDITNVFNQTHLDSYKGANLHISIDASGSMGGPKWISAVKMTIAIAVAAKSTANKINVQVSIRGTQWGDKAAELVYVYDSKVNNIDQLIRVLRMCNLNATTPEGLCFEAMYKRNLLKSSDSETDSYFINISDGEPSMHTYHGNTAVEHTRQWVNKMSNKYNMHMLGYFLSDNGENNLDASSAGRKFKLMYGRDARGVNPTSLVELAKTMNDKFLAAKVSH